MKMKKMVTMVLTAVAMCSIAVAGPDWNNAAPGDSLWSTPGNWNTGVLPGVSDAPAIHGQAVGPTVNSSVPQVNIVRLGIFAAQPGAMVVTTGASLWVNTFEMGNINNSYNDAVIVMDGGLLRAATVLKVGGNQSARIDISGGILNVANPGAQLLVGASGMPWSRGKINITGTGDVRADTLVMNTSTYQQDSRILINDSGLLKIRGDQTGGGTDLMTYIGNSWIHTTDSGKWIDATYNATWDETVVSAIPEPATLGLFGLLGGGMLWIRKRFTI